MNEEAYIDDLTSYDDLSYNDFGDDYVELLHRDEFVDDIEVNTDNNNHERVAEGTAEYIIVNSEMIYLDSIKKN